MIVKTSGTFFRVRVSRKEVSDFRANWPCSRLPDRAITFEFDARNGDLVDVTDGVDGDDALALSYDAQAYGERMLGIAR